MLNLIDFLEASKDKAKIFKNFSIQAEESLTEKLTICIPDLHLLEKGPTDDFFEYRPWHEERFTSFLDFLIELKDAEKENLEIIQLGDMYDLWQARGNTSLIHEAYVNILELLDYLGAVYVVGNHDIDIIKWYETETFGRKWRYFSNVEGKRRVIYEHGFQADFANNQNSWSGVLGRNITIIVGLAETIDPDIDVILSSAWEDIKRIFDTFNSGLTPRKNPAGFNTHEYLDSYLKLMEKYNSGDTDNHFEPTALALAVVGHTHSARLVQKPKADRRYYLMDCGSWVNGGHEFGLISGKDMAICQWG